MQTNTPSPLTDSELSEIEARAKAAIKFADCVRDKRTELNVPDYIVPRLRGLYARGPALADGSPEFGWRDFNDTPGHFTPGIQKEAADTIENALRRIYESVADIPRLLATISELRKEKEEAQGVCLEAYQATGVMGAALNIHNTVSWEHLMDNLIAAAQGEKPPHASLLPWPYRDDETAYRACCVKADEARASLNQMGDEG